MDYNTPYPPASNPPPPLYGVPPTSPPPRRRGRGWMLFSLILLAMLGLSMLLNLGWLMGDVLEVETSGGRTAEPRLDEVVMRDHTGSDKILVVNLDGVITSGLGRGFSMVDILQAQFRRAAKDDKIKAVLIKVDSPGGEVLASDEIFKAVVRFQDDTGKPVVCSMGSLAASGGYYVAVGARWIVANELTITGSIGVIMGTYNYRGLMDKVGVVPMTFKSGRYKDMLSSSKEPDHITPEEKAMVQGLIDETFGRFKDVVLQGRTRANKENAKSSDKGRPLADEWKNFADGRILSGSEAFKHGFVDELGDFDKAVERTQKLAGTGKCRLVEYRPRADFADLFNIFGQSSQTQVKVDLGFQPSVIEAGKMYFLAPTYLH
jgi:protease-4